MTPCVIVLQELKSLCYKYSVAIDLNFIATKSYCVACTPKLVVRIAITAYKPFAYLIYRLYKVSWIYNLVVTTVMMQKC